ncbi:MAG: T9SS type B sorting domain-containing protein [Flavobacterium sp.]|nr:T9SS type B sorting domain-containing protein [Flavobacterium sp.]
MNANIGITNISTFENTSNPQMIYAKVTNLNTVNRCDAIVSFPLQVNRLPEPLINDGYVCYDQNNNQLIQSYTLDTQLNQNTHTFEWYFNTTLIANEQNASLEVSNPGDYFVIATNIQTGCISEPFSATVTRSEPANFTTRVEYSFNDTVAIIVSATGLGNYSYQLNNEIAQSSPIFENVAPGTHQIRVYDLYGCNDTFAEVIVLNYTKFFTPNGDGYNDHWQIQGIYDQPDAKIYIYDRYGKLLKQLNPREIGWDGTFNGSKLPSTDYWFTVTYMENGEQKEFKSHLL